MNTKNSKVAVIGFGVTGISVVDFLYDKSLQIDVFDQNDQEKFDKNILNKYSKVVFNFNTNDFDVTKYDFIIVSPGVKKNLPVVVAAYKNNIPVHNDLTLFIEKWREIGGKVLGITGSNGKTTVTNLLGNCFKKITDCVVGGNIGNSPLGILNNYLEGNNNKLTDNLWAVLEISSAQLDFFQDNHYLDICIITNLSSNHLDRYDNDMNKYAKAKLRGVNADNTTTIIFDKDIGTDEYIIPNLVCNNIINIDPDQINFEIKLPGYHNVINTSFVLKTIEVAGFKITDQILDTIKNFSGLPHRNEFVAQKDEIIYINDSKSTSPDAIRAALESFGKNKNIILIAGGNDKKMDFSFLREKFKKYVRKLIILPGDLDLKLIDLAKSADLNDKDFVRVEDMEQAVNISNKLVKKGEVILLSPGSYSKNYYKSYEERGDIFKSFVNKYL